MKISCFLTHKHHRTIHKHHRTNHKLHPAKLILSTADTIRPPGEKNKLKKIILKILKEEKEQKT